MVVEESKNEGVLIPSLLDKVYELHRQNHCKKNLINKEENEIKLQKKKNTHTHNLYERIEKKNRSFNLENIRKKQNRRGKHEKDPVFDVENVTKKSNFEDKKRNKEKTGRKRKNNDHSRKNRSK